MKFCPECRTMLYIATTNDTLLYTCRTCSYTRAPDNNQNDFMVLDSSVAVARSFQAAINSYTKHDPTLPIAPGVRCTKPGCEGSSVAYIRYDTENMKYAYLCLQCDHAWPATAP